MNKALVFFFATVTTDGLTEVTILFLDSCLKRSILIVLKPVSNDINAREVLTSVFEAWPIVKIVPAISSLGVTLPITLSPTVNITPSDNLIKE